MEEINLAIGVVAILLALAATLINADTHRLVKRAQKILDDQRKEG